VQLDDDASLTKVQDISTMVHAMEEHPEGGELPGAESVCRE
jgi:hypothetical protein